MYFSDGSNAHPRCQSEQAKLRDGIYCPNSYAKMDNDSPSLTFTDGSPTYSEVCTGVLCRRVQQKPPVPPCAPTQLVTNSAPPGTAGALLGEAADMVDKKSHKTRRAMPELLFVTPVLLQNGNGRFLVFPFLHTVKLSLYCMGMCIASLTVSKSPHVRNALRSCSQHGEEEK